MKILDIEEFLKLDNLAKVKFLQELIKGNSKLKEEQCQK